jgi:hypothetical protein
VKWERKCDGKLWKSKETRVARLASFVFRNLAFVLDFLHGGPMKEMYKREYEMLAKAVREKDLKIVALQKELCIMQEQLDDLREFESMLNSFQRFFALVSKQKKFR